jgi:hypothetical protein
MAQNPMQQAAGLMGRSPFAKRFQMGHMGQMGQMNQRGPIPPAMPFGYNPQATPQGTSLPPEPIKPPIINETPPIIDPPKPPVVNETPPIIDPPKPPVINETPPIINNPWHPWHPKKKPVTAYNA